MAEKRTVSIASLILVPALITLAVTILRLEGELHHWSSIGFNRAAGGGGALVGISWLPIIFGPYFALKLSGAGRGWLSLGKSILYIAVSLVVFVAGAVLAFSTITHPSILTAAGFAMMLIAAFVPRAGWRSFGNALIAYAFAARIPVLIVMFFAMRGNGGAGWGTHYDAVAPMFANAPFATKFVYEAVLPQMTMWIGYTVVLGSVLGIIVAAAVRRKSGAAPAEA